jgi:predicted MFS family arabinose efflux permease
MKTSGISSFCNSFTSIFAPVVTTAIYAFIGMKYIIMIDLTTFIFAFLTLCFLVRIPKYVPKNKDEKISFLKTCSLGLRYIVNKKGVFHLILFMSFVNLIAAIYNCNFAPMVLSRNGYNELELGIVSSTIGIAGLIGSILVSFSKKPKKRITLILNIMSFSFLICNCLLGIGRNFYVWTFAVFAGNCFIPFLTANVEYIMRTEIPLEMQGRVFAARNTLQFTSIPVGYLLGGFFADKIFEPFMNTPSSVQQFLTNIVGSGAGSGIALIYIVIGIIGFLGCCVFRFDKDMKVLDN